MNYPYVMKGVPLISSVLVMIVGPRPLVCLCTFVCTHLHLVNQYTTSTLNSTVTQPAFKACLTGTVQPVDTKRISDFTICTAHLNRYVHVFKTDQMITCAQHLGSSRWSGAQWFVDELTLMPQVWLRSTHQATGAPQPTLTSAVLRCQPD